MSVFLWSFKMKYEVKIVYERVDNPLMDQISTHGFLKAISRFATNVEFQTDDENAKFFVFDKNRVSHNFEINKVDQSTKTRKLDSKFVEKVNITFLTNSVVGSAWVEHLFLDHGIKATIEREKIQEKTNDYTTLGEIIDRVENVTFKCNKSLLGMALKVSEENGELCEAVACVSGIEGTEYKQLTNEDVKEEAMDVIIATLSVYIKANGSSRGINTMMSKKIDKWVAKSNIKE